LQLYVSVDAATKESLKAVNRPLFSDFWEHFLAKMRFFFLNHITKLKSTNTNCNITLCHQLRHNAIKEKKTSRRRQSRRRCGRAGKSSGTGTRSPAERLPPITVNHRMRSEHSRADRLRNWGLIASLVSDSQAWLQACPFMRSNEDMHRCCSLWKLNLNTSSSNNLFSRRVLMNNLY
jgi:hypothetical protein